MSSSPSPVAPTPPSWPGRRTTPSVRTGRSPPPRVGLAPRGRGGRVPGPGRGVGPLLATRPDQSLSALHPASTTATAATTASRPQWIAWRRWRSRTAGLWRWRQPRRPRRPPARATGRFRAPGPLPARRSRLPTRPTSVRSRSGWACARGTSRRLRAWPCGCPTARGVGRPAQPGWSGPSRPSVAWASHELRVRHDGDTPASKCPSTSWPRSWPGGRRSWHAVRVRATAT